MEAQPLVSICIPTHNQADTIGETLASAARQTWPNCEIVVSDDASTDATPAIVEAFRNGLPCAGRERMRYLRNDPALGIGGNFDAVVRAARGEAAVKVDSDDVLEPGFVEALLNALRVHPLAGWAHANVRWIDERGRGLGLAHTRKASGYESAEALAPRYLVRSDTCHCVMLRKRAYERVGGYRLNMKTCEDWLLWIEMIMDGWGCYYDERPLAAMRRHRRRAFMSRRRLDYIESIELLRSIVRGKWDAGVSRRLNLERSVALRLLDRSLGRSCLSAARDERSPAVRRALLRAHRGLDSGLASAAVNAVHRGLPPWLLRAVLGGLALPRRAARSMVQRRRQSGGVG